MLVCIANAGSILMRVASYYFERMQVTLDCINNGKAYIAGGKYRVYLDENTIVEGWCEKCDYKQGFQTRTTLVLGGSKQISGGQLTIKYVSSDNPPGNIVLATRVHVFPVGYGYEIENPWLDITIGSTRYYFRPVTAKTSGTMTSESVVVTVQCHICLIHNTKTGVLKVISVDGVSSTNNIAEID